MILIGQIIGYKQQSNSILNEKPSQSSFSMQSSTVSMTKSASKKAGPPPGLRNIGNTCFM